MLKLIIQSFQVFFFLLALTISTAETADAVTPRVRTNDWKLQHSSIREVIYYSDYNGTYGTNYSTVTVGL